jgi:hypothetical protein
MTQPTLHKEAVHVLILFRDQACVTFHLNGQHNAQDKYPPNKYLPHLAYLLLENERVRMGTIEGQND